LWVQEDGANTFLHKVPSVNDASYDEVLNRRKSLHFLAAELMHDWTGSDIPLRMPSKKMSYPI